MEKQLTERRNRALALSDKAKEQIQEVRSGRRQEERGGGRQGKADAAEVIGKATADAQERQFGAFSDKVVNGIGGQSKLSDLGSLLEEIRDLIKGSPGAAPAG